MFGCAVRPGADLPGPGTVRTSLALPDHPRGQLMAGPTDRGDCLGAALNDLLRFQVTPATGCRPTRRTTGMPSSASRQAPTVDGRPWRTQASA